MRVTKKIAANRELVLAAMKSGKHKFTRGLSGCTFDAVLRAGPVCLLGLSARIFHITDEMKNARHCVDYAAAAKPLGYKHYQAVYLFNDTWLGQLSFAAIAKHIKANGWPKDEPV